MEIEHKIKILKNLVNIEMYQDFKNSKKELEDIFFKDFQKNLLKTNSSEFQQIVLLAIDYKFTNQNFISKVNKYYSQLENTAENRGIKSNKFLLKIIELNTIPERIFQLKHIEEFLSRLNKIEKINNWELRNCVSFSLI